MVPDFPLPALPPSDAGVEAPSPNSPGPESLSSGLPFSLRRMVHLLSPELGECVAPGGRLIVELAQ